MGLEIDPTKCGNGITKGTKSAHIFLKKPSLSLAITGINTTFVAHFTTPLLTLGFHTNTKTFDQYFTFARSIMTIYYMSACIHKTVTCTAEITEGGILTSHLISETAQEAQKNYKEKCTCRPCFMAFVVHLVAVMPPTNLHHFSAYALSISVYILWLAALYYVARNL